MFISVTTCLNVKLYLLSSTLQKYSISCQKSRVEKTKMAIIVLLQSRKSSIYTFGILLPKDNYNLARAANLYQSLLSCQVTMLYNQLNWIGQAQLDSTIVKQCQVVTWKEWFIAKFHIFLLCHLMSFEANFPVRQETLYHQVESFLRIHY